MFSVAICRKVYCPFGMTWFIILCQKVYYINDYAHYLWRLIVRYAFFLNDKFSVHNVGFFTANRPICTISLPTKKTGSTYLCVWTWRLGNTILFNWYMKNSGSLPVRIIAPTTGQRVYLLHHIKIFTVWKFTRLRNFHSCNLVLVD